MTTRSSTPTARAPHAAAGQTESPDMLIDVLQRVLGRRSERYWRRRAAEHGRRAVLNLGHRAEDFDAITEMQRAKIFPWLATRLDGREALAVDLGCGPGRFSGLLAGLIPGCVAAVDPIDTLLKLAPPHQRVMYVRGDSAMLPIRTGSADLVWICLVLGGLEGRLLKRTILEVARVLRPSGLLFLIENSTAKPSPVHWRYRTFEDYRRLLPFVSLAHLSDYDDLGETISIMAGRKNGLPPSR